jgi:cell division GTPase FtsZ
MRQAEEGVEELQKDVDTLIHHPNQNLFRSPPRPRPSPRTSRSPTTEQISGRQGVTDLMVRRASSTSTSPTCAR